MNESYQDDNPLTPKQWDDFDRLLYKFSRAYAAIADFNKAAVAAKFLKGHEDRHDNDLYDSFTELFDFSDWDFVNDVFINYNEDNRMDNILPIMDKAKKSLR